MIAKKPKGLNPDKTISKKDNLPVLKTILDVQPKSSKDFIYPVAKLKIVLFKKKSTRNISMLMATKLSVKGFITTIVVKIIEQAMEKLLGKKHQRKIIDFL